MVEASARLWAEGERGWWLLSPEAEPPSVVADDEVEFEVAEPAELATLDEEEEEAADATDEALEAAEFELATLAVSQTDAELEEGLTVEVEVCIEGVMIVLTSRSAVVPAPGTPGAAWEREAAHSNEKLARFAPGAPPAAEPFDGGLVMTALERSCIQSEGSVTGMPSQDVDCTAPLFIDEFATPGVC